MTTETILEVSGLAVEVAQKGIKNFHLSVLPPNGRVRVAAPEEMSLEAIRVAIATRIGWIRRKQKEFENQERQSPREYIDGESHHLLGRRYRLKLVDPVGAVAERVRVPNNNIIELYMSDSSNHEDREKAIDEFYRNQLRAVVTPLIVAWSKRLGIEQPAWQIRRMKTRWGSCNADQRRILLNLELAKKSEPQIEYVVVHELVHFKVGDHGTQFQNEMNRLLPNWQILRSELNRSPLPSDLEAAR